MVGHPMWKGAGTRPFRDSHGCLYFGGKRQVSNEQNVSSKELCGSIRLGCSNDPSAKSESLFGGLVENT